LLSAGSYKKIPICSRGVTVESDVEIQLMTVDEAAKVLLVSKNTLWRLVHARKIGSVHVGRQRRISKDAIREYLQRGEVPAVR
jgi:excisionase family DNA binding protein